MYVVSLISLYMECPTEEYILVAKRVLRYLKGTIDFGVFNKTREGTYLYMTGRATNLIGFSDSDSDYAGDLDDKKNTFVYHTLQLGPCRSRARDRSIA